MYTKKERKHRSGDGGAKEGNDRTARKLQLIEIVCLPTNVMSDNDVASICQD